MTGRTMKLACVALTMAALCGIAAGQAGGGRGGAGGGGGGGGRGAVADGDRVVKLVDARDLAAVLPRNGGRSPIIDVFTGVRNVLRMDCEMVGDGLFLMSGSSESQDQAMAILNQMRSLYDGQYEVSLVCYPAAAAGAPEIGASVNLNEVPNPPIRLRQVLTRRVETAVEASKTVTYIAKWQPVVSEQSVGYDAQPEKAKSGLEAMLLVGASDVQQASSDGRGDGFIDLRIRGQLSEIDLKDVNVSLPGMKTESLLPMQMPTVLMRSINAETPVGGEGRVVAVVSGFRAGEVMVVAAAVRPAGGAPASTINPGKPAGGGKQAR